MKYTQGPHLIRIYGFDPLHGKLDPPYVEQPQDKKATATSFHIDLCDSKRD